MVSEERHCIDILTQISAATTAQDTLALRLLEGHVNSHAPDGRSYPATLHIMVERNVCCLETRKGGATSLAGSNPNPAAHGAESGLDSHFPRVGEPPTARSSIR